MRYLVDQRSIAEAVAISRLRDYFAVEIWDHRRRWLPDPRTHGIGATERVAPKPKPKRRRGWRLW